MNLAPSISVVSDGAAGNELQALALAGALSSAPPRLWRLRARWPWSLLAPQWAPVLRAQQWLPALHDEGPDLAIGAGRLGAAALLTLKRACSTTRTVQILDPRIDPGRFDWVIAPEHDRLEAPNVISIHGSLNAIDELWLERERLAHRALGELPGPRTVVLIGGQRRGVNLDSATFKQLARTLADWHRQEGGSVLVIGSRRTPAAWQRALRQQFADAALLWFDTTDGANPYRGALGWAQRFVVTADSVNMQSEALATGRPVYSLCSGEPSGKLGLFQRAMLQSGRLRRLEAEPATWQYAPLRELQRISALLRAKLKL